MIKNDWIVGARFNYEQDTPFPRYIALLSTTTTEDDEHTGVDAEARTFNTCERSFISSVTNERWRY